MSQQYPSQKYDPMASEGKVELDFPVLRFWWKNGNAKAIPDELDDAAKADLRKKLGVSYFGGWCANRQKADEALAAMSAPMIPGFALVTMTGSKNARFEVYSARQIAITPIIKRVGWFENEGRNTSRHEILAYAAYPDAKTKTFIPWGYVLLSGQSFSGLAIANTIAAWGRKIASVIEDPKAHPAWAHWVTLGTLRSDIYTEQRGRGENTSPITPCEFYLPDDKVPLKDFVAKRYIGDDVLAECIEARELSMAWAQYWNERTEAFAESAGPASPDNFGPDAPYNPNPAEGDIPF